MWGSQDSALGAGGCGMSANYGKAGSGATTWPGRAGLYHRRVPRARGSCGQASRKWGALGGGPRIQLQRLPLHPWGLPLPDLPAMRLKCAPQYPPRGWGDASPIWGVLAQGRAGQELTPQTPIACTPF